MKIIIVKNYEEVSKKAANIVASQVILEPTCTLGLATGNTPLGMYNELINFYKSGDVDFSEVKVFNLDEYYGLKKDDPQSYSFYMEDNFFKDINVKNENKNIPNGLAKDIDEECRNYEIKIEDAGGIDLQVLGIGRNGHIGFNEPDIKFEAITHLVNLDADTIEANSRFFKSINEVPTKAISMGIKTIMHTRKIVLLASGKEKAEAVFNTIKGNITPSVPASVLQLHPDVILIVDADAASLL